MKNEKSDHNNCFDSAEMCKCYEEGFKHGKEREETPMIVIGLQAQIKKLEQEVENLRCRKEIQQKQVKQALREVINERFNP